MLRVVGAVVRYGEHRALDGVDLSLEAGETIAVLGPSGSGKTTLLRVVAGLQQLDAGRVCWAGDDLARVAAHERHFGLMFQEYALFPHRDVAGNVEFGLRMTTSDRGARARRVDDVLDLVGLDGFQSRRVASLSGGEQQRVALARALAVSPRLLMFDEPLGALDRVWRHRLLMEIRSILDRAGLPALYVTHDHDEAFAVANRVAIMRAGRVVQLGEPANVWRAPVDVWTATFLGFGPVVAAEARAEMVHTPWGALRSSNALETGPVDAIVRPDGARIDDSGPIEAAIVRSTFTGTRVELAAVSQSGPPLTVVVVPRDAPAIGDRVRLSIDPDALLVYPRRAD
ncbi:MAG: thiamine transport system ATP-binding protein [Actinomycetota bacterium]|nr:thiamine transport system ATP-binding protein [Actinomycetota bacterium]